MLMTKLFSLKMGLMALGLLVILWILPESLISSQDTSNSINIPANIYEQPLLSAQDTINSPSSGSPASAPSRSRTVTTIKSVEAPPSPRVQDDMPQRPSLISQGILLTLMSLLPFVIMILTSFLKVVVVLSLLRTALGVQQAPPNQVINGVAFLLSLFIMYPTGAKMLDAAKPVVEASQAPDSLLSPDSSTYVIALAKASAEPMREFLKKNSSPKHQALFYRLAYRGLPDQYKESLKPDDFIVLIPSYITGQLKDAFEIGVLIYIPFFVIDLVTSNILLAMGMMMLSPVTISMPLKLFLLVMLDGWTILIEGLVKTFQV